MNLTKKKLNEWLRDEKLINSVFFGEAHSEILRRLKREAGISEVVRRSCSPMRKAWEKQLLDEKYNWRLFGTLTTQGGLSGKQITRHIEKWFEMVVNRLNTLKAQSYANNGAVIGADDLTVFWVAEANSKKDDYLADKFHLHVLIQCNDEVFADVYNGMRYNQFNTFDCAWQYTQGRKPFIWKTDEHGLQYRHEIAKYRVQLLPLEPTDSSTILSKGWKTNRCKYVAKYIAKEMTQFGFLTPNGVQKSILFEGDYVTPADYLYEYAQAQSE